MSNSESSFCATFIISPYFNSRFSEQHALVQEILAGINHQEEFRAHFEVSVLFTIIVQTEELETCEILAQLWEDICLWLFHLAAVTGSSYSFWAGIHLFMCNH